MPTAPHTARACPSWLASVAGHTASPNWAISRRVNVHCAVLSCACLLFHTSMPQRSSETAVFTPPIRSHSNAAYPVQKGPIPTKRAPQPCTFHRTPVTALSLALPVPVLQWLLAKAGQPRAHHCWEVQMGSMWMSLWLRTSCRVISTPWTAIKLNAATFMAACDAPAWDSGHELGRSSVRVEPSECSTSLQPARSCRHQDACNGVLTMAQMMMLCLPSRCTMEPVSSCPAAVRPRPSTRATAP